METTLSKIYQFLKKIALKVFKVVENVWVKRVATILVLAYAIYLIYQNFRSLEAAITTLSINVPLAILSSVIVILTFFLSISAWQFIVLSFGFNFKWMDMAHVQMMSSIGKYIPGSIWNYSSKIYLSHKLGIPLKKASLAIIAEISVTYLIAFCMSLVFFPATVLPNASTTTIMLIRISGWILLGAILLIPTFIKKISKVNDYIKNKKALFYAILLRLSTWIVSGLGFSLLVKALGLSEIDLPIAIATITTSFFVGFLAFFLPDGIVIRETIIVFMLRDILSSSDAMVLSLVYRLLLILLEFLIIFIIFIIWKIREAKLNPKK